MRYRMFRDHGGNLRIVEMSREEVREKRRFATVMAGCGVVWTVAVIIAAGLI